MCETFIQRGYDIITGGTDNHLFLVNLKNKGISGARAEKILEYVGIYVNKNTVPGDISALNPSGIRIGTSAITTLKMRNIDSRFIVGYINSVLNQGVEIIKIHNPENMIKFMEHVKSNETLNKIKISIKNFMHI